MLAIVGSSTSSPALGQFRVLLLLDHPEGLGVGLLDCDRQPRLCPEVVLSRTRNHPEESPNEEEDFYQEDESNGDAPQTFWSKIRFLDLTSLRRGTGLAILLPQSWRVM